MLARKRQAVCPPSRPRQQRQLRLQRLNLLLPLLRRQSLNFAVIARAERSNHFKRQVAIAACLLFFVAVATTGYCQSKTYRPPPNYVQFGKPDQAEGRRIIEDFRLRGLPSGLYLEFELQVMPRRGDGRTIPARLWVGHNESGPIWRLELVPADASAQRRLLVQNGPQSALWSWRPGAAVEHLGIDALFERLADTDLTAFDLQMPFIFWNDFVFEGVARIRGRPAHVFLMYPPSEVSAKKPELTGVRVYLDTQFNALVQAEQIGAQDSLLKSMTILDLKKVDEQWIPKSTDFRDDETRNKTRFAVTGAALGLDFLPTLFDPVSLADVVTPPPASRIRIVGP